MEGRRPDFTVGLKGAHDGPWKTRISEPKQKGFARRHGDGAARLPAVSGVAKEAFKLRAEIVERSFAHNLDRGGMRRTWLRGRENVHKRYLLHVAGHNLSLLMRKLIGRGGRIWLYLRAYCDTLSIDDTICWTAFVTPLVDAMRVGSA